MFLREKDDIQKLKLTQLKDEVRKWEKIIRINTIEIVGQTLESGYTCGIGLILPGYIMWVYKAELHKADRLLVRWPRVANRKTPVLRMSSRSIVLNFEPPIQSAAKSPPLPFPSRLSPSL